MSTKKDILQEMIDRVQKAEDAHCCSSAHCWHRKNGAIWMVVKDGHVVQECCRCPATRTIHLDHAMERRQSEDDYKLDSTGNRWKLWAGNGIPGWTSDFDRGEGADAVGGEGWLGGQARSAALRGRQETKFRC
jgi:hypothetical protein